MCFNFLTLTSISGILRVLKLFKSVNFKCKTKTYSVRFNQLRNEFNERTNLMKAGSKRLYQRNKHKTLLGILQFHSLFIEQDTNILDL